MYKVIEYMELGAFLNERLKILDNGDIMLALKTAPKNHVLMERPAKLSTPSEFIEKLVALIKLVQTIPGLNS